MKGMFRSRQISFQRERMEVGGKGLSIPSGKKQNPNRHLEPEAEGRAASFFCNEERGAPITFLKRIRTPGSAARSCMGARSHLMGEVSASIFLERQRSSRSLKFPDLNLSLLGF